MNGITHGPMRPDLWSFILTTTLTCFTDANVLLRFTSFAATSLLCDLLSAARPCWAHQKQQSRL